MSPTSCQTAPPREKDYRGSVHPVQHVYRVERDGASMMRLETEREACAARGFLAGCRAAERDDHVGPEALLEAHRDSRLVPVDARACGEAVVFVGDRGSAACHH